MQQSGMANSERKTLIYRARAGLGNRMLSSVSALLLAMLTDRALLVEWPDVNVHDVFCEPPGIDWDYILWREEMEAKGLGGYNTWLPHRLCLVDDICLYPPGDSTGSLTINGAAGETPVLADLVCGDIEQALTHQHVFLTSTQYFVPLLFANPVYAAKLNDWFPNGRIAHALLHYLFQPVDPVTAAVDAFVADAFVPGNTVGLQIRSAPIFYFMPGLYSSKDDAAASITATMATCVDEVLPTASEPIVADPATAKLMVASMHADAKRSLVDKYGDRVVLYGGATAKGDDLSVGDTREALVDILLLARTDALVASPLSTFAYTAAAIGRIKPINIHVDVPSPWSDDSILEPICRLPPANEPFPEPCLHANTSFDMAIPMPTCPQAPLPAFLLRAPGLC
ncbi:fucosyltransferase 7 [Thecamonas trahens ATCC 50062]|uniref:Fucosyltransferase 7 n=1 Tax=Thecamonas trahens ATCC 50062 TaxID=461836 RepID=A0A0L0DR53_THETB|nr:fucosyltransferase 7 [Thecamonas trahens ATCC 50062]KNC54496.1 fucosyltransferase 7 [Thecamonas trahens ATCC 50062]|eukprot:XP_013753649.1 fucosyltransferase 7 [Thecamonas trahens ATCC 50062]